MVIQDLIFVVQMEQVDYFKPYEARHPAFAQVLRKAHEQGVGVLAYTCEVKPDYLAIKEPLRIEL